MWFDQKNQAAIQLLQKFIKYQIFKKYSKNALVLDNYEQIVSLQGSSRELSAYNFLNESVVGRPITEPDSESSDSS